MLRELASKHFKHLVIPLAVVAAVSVLAIAAVAVVTAAVSTSTDLTLFKAGAPQPWTQTTCALGGLTVQVHTQDASGAGVSGSVDLGIATGVPPTAQSRLPSPRSDGERHPSLCTAPSGGWGLRCGGDFHRDTRAG